MDSGVGYPSGAVMRFTSQEISVSSKSRTRMLFPLGVGGRFFWCCLMFCERNIFDIFCVVQLFLK